MAELRIAERLVIDDYGWDSEHGNRCVHGYWEQIPFGDLKKGDIFRLWESNGDPDHVVDGKHDVCVALEDPYLPENAESPNHLTLQTLHVNGMVPEQP
jgi:hypothetical protein